MGSETRLVLAIEAAVRGGSIALTENGREVASWHGIENVSRAEELLPKISELLDQTRTEKNRLGRIAVSNGPGSYTGIRIGLATGLGLARALNIECAGVALLPALAELHGKVAKNVVVIPIGRNELCWQGFDSANDPNSAGQLSTGSIRDLIEYTELLEGYDLLMQHDAFEVMADTPDFDKIKSRVYNCGRDLALSIGLATGKVTSDLTPNYVSNSQFRSNPV